MTPAGDIEDIDPGLAQERTELAWTRTAISFAALGGALLKYRPAIGLPVLIVGAVTWKLGRLPSKPGTSQARHRRLLLIAVTITALSAAALVVSFLGHAAGGLR
jgi:uncharacterized membrane protein YidH (DUF202 family)